MSQVNEQIASIESGGDYSAKNPESSASGKYQFMPQTFEGVKKNNPDLPQISFDEFKKNPTVQEQYQVALLDENNKALEKHGIEKTPVSQYVMHWAGAPTGTALLRADDNDPLGHFINEKVLAKNKLHPAKTVGEFKADINAKMERALAGKGIDPTQAKLDEVYKEQRSLGQTALGPSESLMQKNQLSALNNFNKKTEKFQPGTSEYSLAVADAISHGEKKEYGPNWTNAIISAALGNKDQALTWITGGQIKEPTFAEVMATDPNTGEAITKQVWVNRNDRGDKWYTDPATGKRLNDDLTVNTFNPDSSVGRSAINKRVEAGAPLTGKTISGPEAEAHTTAAANINMRSDAIPSERTLLQNISTNNARFGEAINNGLREKDNQAMLDVVNAVKSGKKIDDALLAQAASKLKIKPSDFGAFGQFIKDMSKANELETTIKGKHAPGAGTGNEVDLQQGTAGVAQWIARKDNNLLIQRAYSNYYNDQAKAGKSVSKINEDWEKTDEYKAIQNRSRLQADRLSNRAPNLKNDDPVAVVNNGVMTIKRYNAKTGKAE